MIKWINISLMLACIAAITGTVAPRSVPKMQHLAGNAVAAGVDYQSRWSDTLDWLYAAPAARPELQNTDPMRIRRAARSSGEDRRAAERRWQQMLDEARARHSCSDASMKGAKRATELAKRASEAARKKASAAKRTAASDSARSIFERSSHYKDRGSTFERKTRRGYRGRSLRRVRR